jgi:mRNA interferase RelE/StbE
MGKYRLVFKKSVARDLREIPNRDVARILKCFDALSEDPRAPGCERLSGLERYRVRRGIYRIVYEIRDDALLVVVVRVGHRRDVYRDSRRK